MTAPELLGDIRLPVPSQEAALMIARLHAEAWSSPVPPILREAAARATAAAHEGQVRPGYQPAAQQESRWPQAAADGYPGSRLAHPYSSYPGTYGITGRLSCDVPNMNVRLMPGQAPTWSARTLDQMLAGTPMAGMGRFIYAESMRYGIDDRIPMIIASNESGFGRSRLGMTHHNPFGMRGRSGDGWQNFPNYQYAIDSWFRLIGRSYYDCATYAQMMHRYAPASDGNSFPLLVRNGMRLAMRANQVEAYNRSGYALA